MTSTKAIVQSTARCLTTASVMALLAMGPAIAQEKVEVMHWWTSGGEANALKVLKEAVQAQGITWQDSAVAGGSGTNAYQVLQARVAAGDPPAAMSMHGQEIIQYASEDLLGDLTEIATSQHWDDSMAPELQALAKYKGHYVGVPIDEHRHNWMWISKPLLDRYGGVVPTTWDQWFAIADKMKADGVTPLAHGGQPWQELLLWEDVLTGVGGAQFHKAALSDLDPAALGSDTMVKTFDTFRKVLSYADPGAANRDWNLATAMVITNKAAFQFMGDWAKGEFAVANKAANTDFLCAPAPGTKGDYVFLSDFFGFFPINDATDKKAQMELAALIMSPEVQSGFNVRKGSIPARTDADASKFDPCGQAAIADRAEAAKNGTILPSLSQNTAQPGEATGVFSDAVTAFANDPTMTAAQAIDHIKQGLAGIK